jgi:aminopeptidase N
MVSGLTFYLSQKYAPQRTEQFKMLYEDELQRALAEDGSSSSTFITPKSYFTEIN